MMIIPYYINKVIKSGPPTVKLLRSAKRIRTHSKSAHNADCRCASYVLKFADSEVKAHLPASGVNS